MITELDKQTALVLIDLQKGIVGYSLAHPIETVLGNAARLADAFHNAGLPVVIVNVNTVGAAWTKVRKDAKPPANTTIAADWLDIAPQIKTQPGDIFITKHTWNAFYETTLNSELKKHSVTGIVMAGVSTSVGVEGTARSASERAYNITFACDAMTDMFLDAHEHSIKRIFPRIGEVGTTDEVIAYLNR